jgi:hypothetical protein
MGYCDTTTKQFKVYSPDLGYTTRVSRVEIDETIKGGTVDLRIRDALVGPQGTPNTLNDRRARGRPRQENSPSNSLSKLPTKMPENSPSNSPTNLPSNVAAPTAEPTAEPTKNRSTLQVKIPLFTPPDNVHVFQDNEAKATKPNTPKPMDTENEAPRYFTRSKRKRSDSIIEEEERFSKAIKAMLAQIQESSDNELDQAQLPDKFIDENAFPASEILGIKIPTTHKEAVSDPKYSGQWKAAMAEEILSLIANGT